MRFCDTLNFQDMLSYMNGISFFSILYYDNTSHECCSNQLIYQIQLACPLHCPQHISLLPDIFSHRLTFHWYSEWLPLKKYDEMLILQVIGRQVRLIEIPSVTLFIHEVCYNLILNSGYQVQDAGLIKKDAIATDNDIIWLKYSYISIVSNDLFLNKCVYCQAMCKMRWLNALYHTLPAINQLKVSKMAVVMQ